MKSWNKYHAPKSLGEAIALLESYGNKTRIVAGGTDLILDLEFGRDEKVDALVDVTSIEGLDRIEESGNWIIIGAAATHADIAVNSMVRRHGMALAEGSAVVGGPQVRNVATIGGNLAHALPAADGTTGLMVLDAHVLIQGPKNVEEGQWRPLQTLFSGPGKNFLKLGELITAIRFPRIINRSASAFDRVMRPQGIALPMLAAAASLRLEDESDRIVSLALCIGPAGPVPFRATEAESILVGTIPNPEIISAAISAAQDQAVLRNSRHRASKDYRHELVAVLLNRVLERALVRAGSKAEGGLSVST